ncbi:MAG: GIY-YIG nuclease family protein [Patescibacteria group bacterium]|jgi:excinuclease ABC subunit C
MLLKNLEKLKKIAKKAPLKPGIYFWLNKNGEVLYVGRASNLKNRLSQYFQKNISPRILEMVNRANNIKYQVTESLLEAIILEATKIKKFWPKYNIVDRDNRSFLYLVIPKIDFAKPLIVRGTDLQKFPPSRAKIFGPYQSFHLLQNALRLIRQIFPYGNCRPHQGRACFDYQIGLCPGGCIDKINAQDYQKNINNIKLLLGGFKNRLINKLKKENPEKIKALQHLQDVSLLDQEKNLQEKNINRLEAYDISHHGGQESYGSMVVFENGLAVNSKYRLFKIKEAIPGNDEEALKEVLKRRFKHNNWPLPDIIIIDGGTPQISFLNKFFQENTIKTPFIGISKLAGDKLIFPNKTKTDLKLLAENIKPTLLKAREEAHLKIGENKKDEKNF